MKVIIAVHGRYHAFDLARQLDRNGCRVEVATTYPRWIGRRFLPPSISLRCVPRLEFWRRADQRVSGLFESEERLPAAFGRFASRSLNRAADLLIGWSSAVLEAISVAHDNGMPVIVERGSTHIQHQAEVLSTEYKRLHLDTRPVPHAIIERELAEYQAADAIAVPTTYAARTFTERGVPLGKLIVNPYGVDPDRFSAPPRTTGAPRRPRVLFVGQVGVRKGIVTLLRAFSNLTRDAELHVVGPIEPAIEEVLRHEPTENVVFTGPLSGSRLIQAYASAHIFCLPSIEEGFALVLLEAMAMGLPVVTTNVSGGEELVRPGVDGYLVPASDPEALAERLAWLIADGERRRAMGHAARRRVDECFRWDHYGDRAMTAYRRLLAASDTASQIA